MRTTSALKTLCRSPVRTILTFVMIAVAEYALFMQIAEYTVTARETRNAAAQYCGVGTVESAPPVQFNVSNPLHLSLESGDPLVDYTEPGKFTPIYETLTQAQIEAVSKMPGITSTHTRYMTAGVSNLYSRLDDGALYYDYTKRCIVKGTVLHIEYNEYAPYLDMYLEDCTLLSGGLRWDPSKRNIMISASCEGERSTWRGGGDEQRASRTISPLYKYDRAYFKDTITVGNQYIFVLRYTQDAQTGISHFYLYDYLTDHWCDAIWPVYNNLENTIKSDEYTQLRELMEITITDLHTFDMVYTDDMSAILRFANRDMAILYGRGLSREDCECKAQVCVVSSDFAKKARLELGDTIELKQGDMFLRQLKNLGAQAVTRERYSPTDETINLEIVGIYLDTDSLDRQSADPCNCYSINTIFVPESLLPKTGYQLDSYPLSPAEFSFKVANAWDITAFADTVTPMIEELGLNLIFYDDGWTEIEHAFQEVQKVAIVKIIVFTSFFTGAISFAVFIFIVRRKKDYAIMRALGTARAASARVLLLQLMSVITAAVLAGGAIAWICTTGTIKNSNALIMLNKYAIETSIPVWVVLMCVPGAIILTLLLGVAMLYRHGRKQPLALLQNMPAVNNGRKLQGNSRKADIGYSGGSSKPVSLIIQQAIAETSAAGRAKFMMRYILKHIRRAAVKSALSLLLAILLLAAVGVISVMKQSLVKLIADTEIYANFVDFRLYQLPNIRESGFVKDAYYEGSTGNINIQCSEFTFTVDPTTYMINYDKNRITLAVTNDISRYTGEQIDVLFADGYDISCMNTPESVVILGNGLAREYGIVPGDKITIINNIIMDYFYFGQLETYRSRYRYSLEEERLEIYKRDIVEFFADNSLTLTVAGVITESSGKYDGIAFTPGVPDTLLLDFVQTKLTAEFTLADNLLADDFREYSAKNLKLMYLLMDTSKIENAKNTLRLLTALYPILIFAALLIGAFICSLVILQSSKEAAIMRMLGTKPWKTRMIMSLEQILLCAVGLALGYCVIYCTKRQSLSAEVVAGISFFSALYFVTIFAAALVCSTLATHSSILELLQTKE